MRIFRGLPAVARSAARPLLPITRIAHPRTPTVPFSLFRPFARSGVQLLSTPNSPISPRQPSDQPEAPKTLSQRLKQLIKAYGWYALGVYIVLSTLDFGVAFLSINLLGAEYVSSIAASVKSFVYHVIGREAPQEPEEPGHQGGPEGFYAMIVLAYTIHKTLFLPVRVGLTAAITPRFVNWLGRRGWTGAGGARRASQEIRERVRRGSRGSNSSAGE